MGIFLKAAFEALAEADRPMTATEIVDLAVARGLLETHGKTPGQTMKSKISSDILAKGESSLFMRSGKGEFALRNWKSRVTEHVADRYRKALFDEDILVLPMAALKGYAPAPGIHKGALDLNALFRECWPMRRRSAEEDFSVVQLVSQFVVKNATRYLTYKRTKRLPEARLHDYYSMAFGGHLSPADSVPLLSIYDSGVSNPLLMRELDEEVRLPDLPQTAIQYHGLLYDDSRQVSSQHLGLTYIVNAPNDRFEIGERGFLMDPKYETLDEIARATTMPNGYWQKPYPGSLTPMAAFW